MTELPLLLSRAIFMGIGATLAFDAGGQVLKYAFQIPPSNICLIGRWVRTLPEGQLRHANIATSPPKRAECAVGWVAHYLIGITLAVVFVALAGDGWLQQPTPLPAVVFGVVTVLAPFAIMQPLFGLGLAASKTSNPGQARVRSLMNHTAFGVGLYVFAWLANWLTAVLA